MKRRQSFWLGVRVSCGIVLSVAGITLVLLAMEYNGECGGFWPGLSSPHPCSFWDHASFYLILSVIVFGPVLFGILLMLLIPPLVGYLLNRRRKASV
jgi:hypothetical protein